MLRALTLIAAASLTLGACSDKQSTKPPKPNGLVFPVACTIGKDCWIARYTDRDTGPGAADHTCGPETQDGHDGTDITLADFGVMRRGIPVYAAANGKVLTTRDGEKDISVRDRKGGLAEIKGRECGNGVLLRHDDGSESQYCHLQEGSLTIGPGFRVAAGQQIGTVGLSGETEYPHLHFTLRRDGVVIDPFDGKPMADACSSADEASLWDKTPAYQPLTLLALRATAEPPKRAEIWDPVGSVPKDAAALFITGRAFHTEAGDRWHLVIKDPQGWTFFDSETTLEKGYQFHYQYMGKKAPAGGFMPGLWTATLTATRGDASNSTKHTFRVE